MSEPRQIDAAAYDELHEAATLAFTVLQDALSKTSPPGSAHTPLRAPDAHPASPSPGDGARPAVETFPFGLPWLNTHPGGLL